MPVRPLRDAVYLFTFLHMPTDRARVYACLQVCVYSGDSLIPVVAGIGEGLQLDGWL